MKSVEGWSEGFGTGLVQFIDESWRVLKSFYRNIKDNVWQSLSSKQRKEVETLQHASAQTSDVKNLSGCNGSMRNTA